MKICEICGKQPFLYLTHKYNQQIYNNLNQDNMKTKFTKLLAFAITIISLSSCFHKNVLKDEADDVEKVLIYSQDGKNYLIALESIFQATSKSSGGGITTISGYTELRISVYELETGTLIAREKAGELGEDENTIILGCTEGNLWLHSCDDELGLHSLNPLTLEIKVTLEQILEKNPELKDKLAKSEWYSANQFYGYDELEKQLIITDTEGFRYYLNPETLLAEKQIEEIKIPTFFPNRYFSSNVEIDDDYLSFSGDLRNTLTYNNVEINPTISFLNGQLLTDQNLNRLHSLFFEKKQLIQKQLDETIHHFDSLKFENGEDYWYWKGEVRDEYYKLENKKRDFENKIDNLTREINYITTGSFSTSIALQNDSTSFYIAHKSSTNNDAFLVISKIKIENKITASEQWKTVLEDIFYDATAAEQTDAFKTVFSKGNPNFDYQFFDLIDNKIVIFYMLHFFCIDIQTGNVLWKLKI